MSSKRILALGYLNVYKPTAIFSIVDDVWSHLVSSVDDSPLFKLASSDLLSAINNLRL